MIATEIKRNLCNWGEELQPRLFELDTPYRGHSFVVVVVCDLPGWGLDKTEVFAATAKGGAVAAANGGLEPLDTFGRDDENTPLPSHTEALSRIGYST